MKERERARRRKNPLWAMVKKSFLFILLPLRVGALFVKKHPRHERIETLAEKQKGFDRKRLPLLL